MRRQYLFWSIAVFGILGTTYGAYLLVYHFNHGKGLFIPALLLLIFGAIALAFSLVMYILFLISQKKKKNEPINPPQEETTKEEVVAVEEEKPKASKEAEPSREEVTYEPRPRSTHESSSYSYSTVYVKQVGYGPVLRIEEKRILDMRNNTYYYLENDMVMQDGYGPVFEIRGSQIKDAFGSYLYKISGSNINKTFGGFYASISGNYITLYDSSIKYEMTDNLSKRQTLVVVALLFGKY